MTKLIGARKSDLSPPLSYSINSDSYFSTNSMLIDSGQDSDLEVELNTTNSILNQDESTKVELEDGSW